MTDIIVGCPTQNRAWILPRWKEHVDAAIPNGWDAKFVFVVPEADEESIDIIQSWKRSTIIYTDEELHVSRSSWANRDLYNHMCILRNSILRYVREEAPNYFLSVDSDILLDKNVISNMHETLTKNQANAVGGLTYLDQIDRTCTNFANWRNRHTRKGFYRHIEPGTHPVDIIMAIQFMDNLAYNVDYEYHDFGEDFGWCSSLARAGAKIYCDGRVKNKHVMYEEWLDRLDKRVGF